jgi:hypothetical protein
MRIVPPPGEINWDISPASIHLDLPRVISSS